MKILALILFLGCALLLAGVHPPNDNSICKNPLCGHPKSAHEHGGGMCLLFNFHCSQFIK
jgi:hypothetical protein